MIEDSGFTVSVTPFNQSIGSTPDIPVATAATVYQDAKTGVDYLLVFHEVLFFGDKLQGPSLLNPNQMRSFGIVVSDVPKHLDSTSTHSLSIPVEDGGSNQQKLVVPLDIRGVHSGFNSRKPTWAEFESLPRIQMTSTDSWQPSSDALAKKEELHVRHAGSVSQRSFSARDNIARAVSAIDSYHSMCTGQAELNFNGDQFDWASEAPLYGPERFLSTVNVQTEEGVADVPTVQVSSVAFAPSPGDIGVNAVEAAPKKTIITPEALARRWHIGLQTARNTLKVTTQSGIRNLYAPSERKLRFRNNHMRFPTLRGRFYTDQMFANTKSKRGHIGAQVFTNAKGYERFLPLAAKGDGHVCLTSFIQRDGIPKELVSDGAPAEHRGEWGKVARHHRIHLLQTVPGSPWQNRAEHSIGQLKMAIRRAMRRTGSPKRLWCYCGEWVSSIRRLTAGNNPSLEGRTPEEDVSGSTPDISAYAMFDWYQPVWFHDPVPTFPFQKKMLGYFLGVEECSVDLMAFRILKSNGHVVTKKSVWALTPDEQKDLQVMADLAQLEADVKSKIGDRLRDGDVPDDLQDNLEAPPNYLFDDIDEPNVEPAEPEASRPEADDYTPEAYDQYLTAKVLLPHGGESARATVVARAKDADGVPIGRRNPNPLLDTRLYQVEYDDGSIDTVTANLIAENIYSQVDGEGRTLEIFADIVDHRSNGHAIQKEEGHFMDKYGRSHKKRTTKGWDLQVEHKGGGTSWIPLKDLKESHPVQVAEYAKANRIIDEPAFAWWVPDVLRRRDRIIAKVKTRYWSRTHKFGIELPKSVAEAFIIDQNTGTTFWRDAIEKEMRNVMPAFQFTTEADIPIGYKEITLHMVFDIKMDLTRKARLVADGNKTAEVPKEMTYSSVVSRDTVRIALTLAALNGLDVLAADIQNAYLNAPTSEKLWTRAGMEFGSSNIGRPVLIVRALYGLRTSGKCFRDHLATTLKDMGFDSCKADPDLWLRPAVKADGEHYYEYVLCYVDDVLAISQKPRAIMDGLSEKYTLKDGSVKKPDVYLGADIKEVQIGGPESGDKPRWAMSSDTYVSRAIADVERELAENGQCLKNKAVTPMSSGYRPEVDSTPELGPKQANYFQGLIGVLRWICELGRIDILVDVAMLSRFLAAPRKGHLEQALHIFAYLKRHNRSMMVFDDSRPEYDKVRFTQCDWGDYYPGAEEVMPPNAPKPRGKGVSTTCFVDADHAGCRVTRRSHTGIIIFLNKAPVMWFSKRQNTVETSTFGSELIAARIAVEMIEGLRYKLRMMGVPIDGATNFFCDNNSVVQNVSRPESQLKKKHCAVAYHRLREAQAAHIIRVAHEDGVTNIADIATKCLPGPRLRELVQHILW